MICLIRNLKYKRIKKNSFQKIKKKKKATEKMSNMEVFIEYW